MLNSQNLEQPQKTWSNKCGSNQESPSSLHHNTPSSAVQDDEIDLANLTDAKYAEQANRPGISFLKEDGTVGWTPVIWKKKKRLSKVPKHLVRLKRPPTLGSDCDQSTDSNSDSSSFIEEDIQTYVREASDIKFYSRGNNQACLAFSTGKGLKSSIQISTPVALRTRSRLNLS